MSAGGHEVGRELAEHGEGGGGDPDDEQEPGRDQHHGPVVAVGGEVDHEGEADGRHRRDRDPRHPGGDRRVDHGEADERREEDEPEGGDVAVAHVPAVEVEIGEQEDEKRRREHRLGARAVDALGLLRHREDALEEAEIDAGVGEHRPGERRGGREDHRPLHHEDDGEEQGQEPGDADDDALVEGEPVVLLAVGVPLPEMDLGQVRGAQLGDEGDGGAGVEGHREHVGVGAVHALRPHAFARRDGDHAGRAEVRPDHPGADQPEAGGDEEALDLLVGVVGQREGDPVRLGAGFARLDQHAPHDAVAAGGGGDLDHVAVRAVVALDRRRQVDRRRLQGDAHRLDGQRRRGGTRRPPGERPGRGRGSATRGSLVRGTAKLNGATGTGGSGGGQGEAPRAAERPAPPGVDGGGLRRKNGRALRPPGAPPRRRGPEACRIGPTAARVGRPAQNGRARRPDLVDGHRVDPPRDLLARDHPVPGQDLAGGALDAAARAFPATSAAPP